MTTTRRRWLRPLAVAAAGVMLTWPALLASAANPVAFTIADQRVTTSSGLARDVQSKLYWTVNDAGQEGTVYGVTAKGAVQGIIGFRVKPKDVESVAMSGRRLYVADIGDAKATRKFVSVYYFTDPQPNNTTVSYRSYDFSYPDGPHDAQALLVDGAGRLYLVTKEAKGGIYRAPEEPSRQGVNELTRVADAPAFVTDGVLLPGGREFALRTYSSVEVTNAGSFTTVARAATPYQKQGESIALSLDGKSLLLGSEGKSSQVLTMAIPSKLANAPKGTATPPPSPTPKPTGAASDAGTDEEPADEAGGASANRAGTIVALALAGVVAVVAGVVVAVRKS